MATIYVERLGGLGNFGGASSHLRSRGQFDSSMLSHGDQQILEKLFRSRRAKKASPSPDAFRYKISRTDPDGTDTIEVLEEDLPAPLVKCVKDEIV